MQLDRFNNLLQGRPRCLRDGTWIYPNNTGTNQALDVRGYFGRTACLSAHFAWPLPSQIGTHEGQL